MPTAKPISQRPITQKAMAARILMPKAKAYWDTVAQSALIFSVPTLTIVVSSISLTVRKEGVWLRTRTAPGTGKAGSGPWPDNVRSGFWKS
ncbi:Uncharacterised protein [Pseudomonas aeruginosa]|nr:Uncharacterised protein [Pseudomonas aeruginosa]